MENISDIQLSRVTRTKANLSFPVSFIDSEIAKEAIDILITEGGKDFYNYVNRIGLATDPHLIVLSSKHHYFYDTAEINKTRTFINLKELNKIAQIRSFLKSHLQIMPLKCNFLGCFVNNSRVSMYSLRKSSSLKINGKRSDDIQNGIVSRFPFINMLYGFMDSKVNSYLTEDSVRLLLKENGFIIRDMTEFNGLTYFHSQKPGYINN